MNYLQAVQQSKQLHSLWIAMGVFRCTALPKFANKLLLRER
jgi:hypothetical protein